VYEHSSAGRDLYGPLFTLFGAEVISLNRSDEFVPIDTEAVSEEDKIKAIQWVEQHQLDWIFSTEGDGDRPLIASETGEWLRGDILGLLTARGLGVEALAVPVSCNTVIELSNDFQSVVRTRIGSPYVIAGIEELCNTYSRVAGFEANGGFLLGSDVVLDNGKVITALPTRDALLPAIALLSLSKDSTIGELLSGLPKRVTYSDRVKEFPREKSAYIISKAKEDPQAFVDKLGFTDMFVKSLNELDGLRITFTNDCVIHLRPSGNAPELRCYTEASHIDIAEDLVDRVLNGVKHW
jgi:phosphomannomutase